MYNQGKTVVYNFRRKVPKNIITDLRILNRIIIETLKGIKHTGLMNFFVIGTIAAILTIFGCLFRTSLGMSTFVNELGNVLEISAYVRPAYNTKNVVVKVRKLPHIQRIKVIPKETSWKKLKYEMNLPSIANPLPDTLHIKVKEQKYIEETKNKIANLKEIEDVKCADELAQKMRLVNDISHTASFVTLLIIGFLTVFIINNTIQLVIQSRKEEIEIMRLMGVNNWYIRAPYLIQGALYGFVGTVLAIIPLGFLQNYLDNIHTFFKVPTPPMATNIVILTMLAMGIVFGAAGSLLSIKKHLKV